MEYDESKKLEVEVSENVFIEDRKVHKKRREKREKFDVLDIAIIPVAIGVFVSLGFLFANIYRATTIVETLRSLANIFTQI